MTEMDDTTVSATSATDSSFHSLTLDPIHNPQSPDNNKTVYLLLGPHEYSTLSKYIFVFTNLIVAGGLLGNALCIRTFLKIGLKDCVTITFFNLAISDIFCLVTLSMFAVFDANEIHLIDCCYYDTNNTFSYYNTILGLDPFAFLICAGKIYDVVFFVSSNIITFLAIQKSVCVLFPFQFKSMFTPRKTLLIVSLIWSYWISVSIICWSFVSFKKVDHGFTADATRILMKTSDGSAFNANVVRYRTLVNYIVLPSLFLVIVFGGLFILTHALTRSARFRQTATSLGNVPQEKKAKLASGEKEIVQANANGPSSKQKLGTSSSSKETLAIMQVAILSTMFLLSQFPAIVWRVAVTIEPELGKAIGFIYFRSLLKKSYVTMDAANASLNFLVYFNFNSRFREVCFQRKLRTEASGGSMGDNVEAAKFRK